ncbi:MAG TPA: hypothetical protein VLB46_19505 [Pyrinomonadaceae bacterium]|nr:hypothetical protein [Pyrinomonadaceae bacterium]
MGLRVPRLLNRWTALILLVLLTGIIGLGVTVVRNCLRLDCELPAGAPGTKCENTASAPMTRDTSDAQELVVEEVQITRDATSALVSAKLKGRFWNETDQNFYVFVGQPSPGGAPVSYSLSADDQFFTDISYGIRNTIQLPHTNDMRIGVMAPQEVSYSPQIYINDPVHADLVGEAAHINTEIAGHEVRIRLPLVDYYQHKKVSIPARLSFTFATARDYVGFIDQVSVLDVAQGETKNGREKSQPPVSYPVLDYSSHVVKNVTLTRQNDASVQIEVETAAPINDWAQTNLFFFFVPQPDSGRGDLPLDPSGSFLLPARWSYYCAVYSPNRLFCKASDGADFSYDTGYSERVRLEAPKGVGFKELGGTKYALALAPEIVQRINAGGNAFALLMTAGRDGFGPTSCFGCNCTGRCNLVRRLDNLF